MHPLRRFPLRRVSFAPKLLKASAVEAVAEFQQGKKFPVPSASAVKTLLLEAEKGKPSEKKVTSRVRMITVETKKSLLFETRDQAQNGWIHRNYITK